MTSFAPFATAAARLPIVRRLAVAVLVAALAACSITHPAPVKRTFLLDPPLPAAVATTKPGVLRMGTFTVAAPFRDRAFVYRTEELKYESDFYSEFFVPPGPMLADIATRALAGAKVFTRVLPGAATPEQGDWVLDAFVSQLFADARTTSPAAEIAITFYVSRTTFPAAVVWSREYRQRVPITGVTPEAMAQAWNAGLGAILADLARDLAAADLTRP
jgi:uncharacterized lipoprotein YmbA